MLYSLDKLTKVKLMSSDSAYADIKDFYFDDAAWTVRYCVADIGTWLSERLVLISPQALSDYSEEDEAFHTNLTKQQISGSPPFDSEKTVSRQEEERLSHYYGWSTYWTAPMLAYPWAGIYTYPPDQFGTVDLAKRNEEGRLLSNEKQLQDQEPQSTLRSFKEVRTYGLRATDEAIGEIEDLLIDPETWQITHLIADAHKWWPGGHVVIDRALIQNISWSDRKMEVAMSSEEVKNAPPYDREIGITEAYQMSLSRYFQGFKDRVHGMRHSVSAVTHDPHAQA